MARAEFPKAIKVAVVKRATVDGNVFCEECGSLAKRWEIDHVNPDALTGKPVLENAKLLCAPCHQEKTALDIANIAKAKRREAKDLGVKNASSKPKADKPRKNLNPYGPPRAMFTDI